MLILSNNKQRSYKKILFKTISCVSEFSFSIVDVLCVYEWLRYKSY